VGGLYSAKSITRQEQKLDALQHPEPRTQGALENGMRFNSRDHPPELALEELGALQHIRPSAHAAL
jgi:hypothetical protein